MIDYIIIGILSACVGISKAVSDIVSHIDIWSNSYFSKFKETSFYGPKDKTWIRKDHPNKTINYLLHNQLVFITDVWHFSNFINNLSITFIILLSVYFSNYYLAGVYWFTRIIYFHLFYHYILIKK